ncbi:MAG: tyrosine-protein phosphatase [Lactobacillus sp.]|nr:tyrosine-protein phosphatase [Lactobacillus sp.]MDN6042649.1 tyrosine-protein phosphatase [Lactobacillus sp.]MDN6053003.1 tyrosine-protein phosphatase [Lactobacillus sp.]
MKVHVLPLATVRNPRDLGGYLTRNGYRVKAHRLLRAGNMNLLSLHDRQYLLQYGLATVVDLRSPAECDARPDIQIPGVHHVQLAVSDDDSTSGGSSEQVKALKARYEHDQYVGFELMCMRYRLHVTSSHAQRAYHQLFELLANQRTGATVIHCSEGKDRTGLAVIFLLSILGVDAETIRQDYLASNELLSIYRANRDQELAAAGASLTVRANMRILGSVCDAFLDTSLLLIEQKYGGMSQYLEEQLGVTPRLRQALYELYLEEKND